MEYPKETDEIWGLILGNVDPISAQSSFKSSHGLRELAILGVQVPVMRSEWAENRENSVRSVKRPGDRPWLMVIPTAVG